MFGLCDVCSWGNELGEEGYSGVEEWQVYEDV